MPAPRTPARAARAPVTDPWRALRSRWFLIPAAWAVPALLAAAETLAFWRMAGRDFPAWRALATQAPGWLAYALLTPAILVLARRLPLRAPRLARNVTVHLLAALLAGALYAATAAAAGLVFAPMPSPMPLWRTFVGWYLSGLPLAVIAWFGVVGVGHALGWFAESKRRELEAARLGEQLAEARLGALRMQLHPHFLFNSLNAVAVLARDGDMRGAVRMLEDLSELLREVLRADQGHEVPLAAELAFVRRYLAIEQVRFSDRLQVAYAVDETLCGEPVPAFLLQPFVENALRHGIARRSAAGRLEIGARRTAGGGMELWVQDDGAGLPGDWGRGGTEDWGVGLSNTAARLAQLHGDGASLALHPVAGGGTRAVVRLPARPA